MSKPFQPRAYSAILAPLVALLFLAGSFAIPPSPVEHEPLVPSDADLASPRPADVPDSPEAPVEPEPQATVAGHALYGAFWEQNLGQWDHDASWVLRGGPLAFLTAHGIELASPDGAVMLAFADGHGSSIQVVEARASTTSVFGAESYVGAQHAERLRVLDVWPGIDVDVYVTSSGSLQYDFRVHPGADPADARIQVSGAEPRVEDGRLVLGPHVFDAPYTFQETGAIDSAFSVDGDMVSVAVGDYDPSSLLVIDPELLYGTLVGGTYGTYNHRVYATKETASGTYFAGTIYQPYYTVKTPQVTQTVGPKNGYYVGFFVHLDPGDNSLLSFVELRSTYTSGYTWGYDMDVDQKGRVYLVGQTGYYTSGGNGIPVVGGQPHSYYFDGFLARFEPKDGGKKYDLQYSTHIHGDYMYNYYERATGVHINPDGSFWVAGAASSDGITPTPTKSVVDPTSYSGNAYTNFYALRFQDGAVPSPDLGTRFGGHYYYYNYPSDIGGDDKGNLYFVGSTYIYPYFPGAKKYPTTPDAIHKEPIAGTGSYGYDNFYGKISADDGSIAHLSYWGTKGYDRGYLSTTTAHTGPGLDVVGEDEIVIAGTAATCCVTRSDLRMTPGAYGSYDGYVSHIKLGDAAPIFSTHVGSKSVDYINDVAYDASQQMYYVGGVARLAVQPDIEFEEEVPREKHNKRYDAFVQAIQPSRMDSSKPLNDQDEHITAYTMYVGNSVGTTSGSYYYQYNWVFDLEVSDHRNLLVGGNQGGSYSAKASAPTTEDAIDTKGVNLYATGFFQKYQLPGGIVMKATDGFNKASSDSKRRLDTKTLTDVELTASFNETMIDWATPADLSWDLDQDGTFTDAVGPGPHVLRRDHEELVKPCVRLPAQVAGALPVETCLDIFFENRPPVISLELYTDPAGFGEPLPYFYAGDEIWYDASSSYDPEGVLDYTAIDWVAEVPSPDGGWMPDPDAKLGGDASLGLVATYGDPGQKRITLTLQDDMGAKAKGTLSVDIRATSFELGCSLGGPVRADRWLDLDVTLPDGMTVSSWVLDMGDGDVPIVGDGIPAGRLRTDRSLTDEGPGVARLTVTTTSGAEATCMVPYDAGPRQVTADFTWETAYAGDDVEFIDKSIPDRITRPITSWQWMVDGVVVDASQNTKHVFAHPGLYMVTLTVSDGFATDTYTRPVLVLEGLGGPMARIGVGPAPYHASSPIQFTDQSLPGARPITQWAWTIGGRSSTMPDPVLSLPGGDHVVTLKVTDAAGFWSEDEITIRVVDLGAVVPEFTASSISPLVGETVIFTDTSRTGNVAITANEWDFGDGSRSGQGAQIEHVFHQPGTYNVTLTLYEQEGQRFAVSHQITVVEPGTLEVREPETPEPARPTADAGPDRRVLAGTVVMLDASQSVSLQSEGLTATWRQIEGPTVDLVPAGTSASLRVPHAVGQSMVFELVVADANGVSVPDLVRLQIVEEHADGLGQVDAPEAGFTIVREGRLVSLEAAEHGVDAEYIWDLGDGTVLEGREVVHEYATFDDYAVTLTVRDVHGQESVETSDVAVRPDQETAGSEVTSQTDLFGQSLLNLVLAALALTAAATAAALLLRRK